MEIENLITGGSGMIGTDLRRLLRGSDSSNFYLSSQECNLTIPAQVDSLFSLLKPKRVIHLAARVGGIQDNIAHPVDYFSTNVLINTNVLNACVKYGVKDFIGMLSSCCYPDVASHYPMTEDMIHQGPPAPTNFSYGYAQRCMLVQVEAINEQYGLNYHCLIPPNLYGPNDKYDDKNSHFVAALMKKIYRAKISGQKKIVLFGSGASLRQFVFSPDIAKLIRLIITYGITETMNLVGDEMNYSIHDIAKIALDACDADDLEIEYDSSKPDGQFNKAIDGSKLKAKFPTFEFTSLYTGIRLVYQTTFEKKKI